MRYATYIGLLLLSFVGIIHAQRYAGDFAGLGTGARAMGLGGAYVAISDDATSVFWNPAGLTTPGPREVQLQHTEQFGGSVNHDVLSLSLPTTGGGMGIGLVRLGVDGISLTTLEDPLRPLGSDNRPIVTQLAGTTDYVFQIAYARRLRQTFCIGGTVKFVHRNLSVGTGNGFGLDAGFLYTPTPNFRLAIALHNLTKTRIRFGSGARDTLDPTLTLGGAYVRPLYKGRLIGTLDVRMGEDTSPLESKQGLHMGVEYAYQNRVAFRMGLNQRHLALGAGLTMPRFALNLAVLEHDQLNNTYRISGSVFF